MFEQKNNTATLFQNRKKEKDTHPDMTGSLLVDGIKKDISAWKKQDKNGNDYISISIKDPYIKPESTYDNQKSPF
jgi:uncharacterized protein (DUF736 family)